MLKIKVQYIAAVYPLELFVMPGNSTPIVGRPWLFALGLIEIKDQNSLVVKLLSNKSCKMDVVKEFPEAFSNELGSFNGGTFSLQLKKDVKPVFCKVRPVPYSLREKIEKELERLERGGVIEAVNESDWGTPIVPVLKTDGQVRICVEFKITVNPLLVVIRHPIPRVNDLVVQMSGAVIFSKPDLAHAYQ